MRLRAAALATVISVAATPAFAQYWSRGGYGPGPYYEDSYRAPAPYYAPGRYYAQGPYRDEGIAPYEVMAIVRSARLQPVSRPWRVGAKFMVYAMNARGETVRVVVDAYRGRIVAIGPTAGVAPSARLAPDPRADESAPGYGPRPGYDNEGYTPPPPKPIPHVQRPGAEGPRSAAVTPIRPPMPRPRPADAPSPAAAEKPAPDAPAAAAAAPPARPAETPSKDAPAAPTAPSFPPAAPLE